MFCVCIMAVCTTVAPIIWKLKDIFESCTVLRSHPCQLVTFYEYGGIVQIWELKMEILCVFLRSKFEIICKFQIGRDTKILMRKSAPKRISRCRFVINLLSLNLHLSYLFCNLLKSFTMVYDIKFSVFYCATPTINRRCSVLVLFLINVLYR